MRFSTAFRLPRAGLFVRDTLTNNGTLTFKYNYRNLITEVRQSSGGSLVAEYLYDANGRRVVKNVNGGIFERYIYADVETISVLNGSQAWKQDFVFDVTGIDRILMIEQADVLDQDSESNTTEITRSYYHRNALGSVMEISTASQTEAASYRYSPYGEVTITRGGSVQSSDPLAQSWGYTSRLHDTETGLTYFRARHQDPVTGKFLQRDPFGLVVGPNLYGYSLSRPASIRDPRGTSPEDGATDPCAELCAKADEANAALAKARAALDAAEVSLKTAKETASAVPQILNDAVSEEWENFLKQSAVPWTPETPNQSRVTAEAHNVYEEAKRAAENPDPVAESLVSEAQAVVDRATADYGVRYGESTLASESCLRCRLVQSFMNLTRACVISLADGLRGRRPTNSDDRDAPLDDVSPR